jgi:hypothetical protein
MNIEISHLSNGLTVITDPMPQLESAALGVWVNAGGLSGRHGRLTVPSTWRSRVPSAVLRALAGEMGSVSGFSRPASREQTAFHAACAPMCRGSTSCRHSPHPTFEQNRLERERQVVLQEIGQARDRRTTSSSITCRPRSSNQPMGWPILGERDRLCLHAGEPARLRRRTISLAG